MRSPQITDEGFAALDGLDQIEYLFVHGAAVTDAGLAHLKTLPRLQSLQLIDLPKVTDAGLRHLAELRHLKVLDLNCPGVTSAGLGDLGRMTQLEKLDLSGTSISLDEVAALRTKLPHTFINKRP